MPVVFHRVKDIVWDDTFEKGLQVMRDISPTQAKKWDSFVSSYLIGIEVKADTEEEAFQELEGAFSFLAECLDNDDYKKIYFDIKEVVWEKLIYETDNKVSQEDNSKAILKEGKGIYTNKEPLFPRVSVAEGMKSVYNTLKEIKEQGK